MGHESNPTRESDILRPLIVPSPPEDENRTHPRNRMLSYTKEYEDEENSSDKQP
jgi:hypothetical protein